MTDTPTTDPHDLCMTDPDKGLCAVAIPLVEAAWCAVVEAGAAGEVDREETMPVLIAALGGVQHHLGHRLGEDVVVTVTFRSEDIHQSITDMINRIIRDPNGRAAEVNQDSDGEPAKADEAELRAEVHSLLAGLGDRHRFGPGRQKADGEAETHGAYGTPLTPPVTPTVDAQDLALAIADPDRQRRGYSHGAA